jgi:5'-methylthioadenosine phosphorylase
VGVIEKRKLTTPFGDPSDEFVICKIGGVKVIFLPRHGKGHRYNPTEVNYRANVFGMKMLGAQWIIAVTAVGSLQEEIVPGDMVIIDSFIDRTQHRQHTFFEEGIVAHVQFGNPMCEALRGMLLEACKEQGITTHDGGAYVNMEGPAFSTKAESNMHRDFKAKVIGMTNIAEARLAREAEISFATVAMATDYDCWREGHDSVTVEEVVATAKANVGKAKAIIKSVIPKVAAFEGPCPMHQALKGAIMTAPEAIPAGRAKELECLVKKYVTIPEDAKAPSREDPIMVLKADLAKFQAEHSLMKQELEAINKNFPGLAMAAAVGGVLALGAVLVMGRLK